MKTNLSIGDALQTAATPILERLRDDRVASRLFSKDASLWGPAAEAEAANRLGWVDPFRRAEVVLAEALELREELRARSIDDVVLCGMGGSSLGPEVVAERFGSPLTILDSTHPAEVLRALDRDLSRTVVVVSSKSGSTLETASHAEVFRHAFVDVGLDPTEHIVFVTDPGSPLESKREAGYRVFLADPHIGGRFSVLSAFGIVPTVLAGADTESIIAEAEAELASFQQDTSENPALRLAAAIAGLLPKRFAMLLRDEQESRWGLDQWIEQLVAESTGKDGKGVLPISLPENAPELTALPENALLVRLGSEARGPYEIGVQGSLGGQLMLWEVATAALGRIIGINPFDQPDVEAAKVAARAVMQDASERGVLTDVVDEQEILATLQAMVPQSGYLSIQAFVDRDSAAAERISSLRNQLAEQFGVPVSLGWGPRYLHSTGQFHKGGPQVGAFLQFVDTEAASIEVPGEPTRFGSLMCAQAHGDRDVLEQRGRPVLTLSSLLAETGE